MSKVVIEFRFDNGETCTMDITQWNNQYAKKQFENNTIKSFKVIYSKEVETEKVYFV